MGNNIRELRQARGWSMRELAERMPGTHFTTIAKIERSQRRLTMDWVEKFAKAFEVKVEEIEFDGWGEPAKSARTIPVIGMVAASNWQEAIERAEEFIPAPVDGRNAFGLVVEGTSMDRVARPGSIVIVDPDDFQLHDQAYYVVRNEAGETTFKQYREGPARLEPVSSDPEHRTIELGREAVAIVGRVVGSYTQL